MANWTGIAAVTATLQEEIRAAVAGRIPTVELTTGRPRQAGGSGQARPRVNLFLYAVAPNPGYRNEELPVRASDGSLVDRPVLAIDLSYLVSLLGPQDSFVPELLAGAILTDLHRSPLLRPERIEAGVNAVLNTDPGAFGTAVPDLEQQAYRIRVTSMSLSAEETTNLWSALGTDFSTTMALNVSVVLLEPDTPAPAGALPVLERDIHVEPTRGPRIDSVDPLSMPFDTAARLTIRGAGFDAPILGVEIGGREAVGLQVRSANELTVRLPPGTPAGFQPVRAVQSLEMGDPEANRAVFESNTVVVVLTPVVTISGSIGNADAVATITPAIDPGQDASLLLSRRPPGGQESVERRIDTSAATAVVGIDADGLIAGTSFVRVRVDGADSLLTLANDGRPTGPQVTVP